MAGRRRLGIRFRRGPVTALRLRDGPAALAALVSAAGSVPDIDHAAPHSIWVLAPHRHGLSSACVEDARGVGDRELIGSDLIGHPANGTHNHLLSFPRHPKAWGLECASDVLANRYLAMQSRYVWRHQGGIVGPVRDCSLEVPRGGGRSP